MVRIPAGWARQGLMSGIAGAGPSRIVPVRRIPSPGIAGYRNPVTVDLGNDGVAQVATFVLTPFPLNQNFDFEGAVTPWTPGGSATLSDSSVWEYHGTRSMLITPNGVTAFPGATSEFVPVIPGQTYTISAEWASLQGWSGGGNTVQAVLNWFTAGRGFISQVFSSSQTLPASLVNGVGVQTTATGVAPATAAVMQIQLTVNGTPPATTLFYVDWAQVVAGSTPAAVNGGAATALVGPSSGGDLWSLDQCFLSTSTGPLDTAQCTVYTGPLPLANYAVTGSLSGGSSQFGLGGVGVPFGWFAWAVWTGGIPGEFAYLRVTGTKTVLAN
jgi:hypothetical protein